MLWLAIVLSLVPVITFLCALRTLDSYKLLALGRILTAVSAGAGAAVAALLINTLMFQRLGRGPAQLAGILVEELLKAIFPMWCVRSHRVGFPVDAGIIGFATGAGFSMVENIVYIDSIGSGTPLLWLVRGLGTAVMHGTTTAIIAILAVTGDDRRRDGAVAAVCGLVIAFAVHAFYNSSLITPVQMAAVVLVGAPALLAGVFSQSERTLTRWLSAKLDRDIEIIGMIDAGVFLESKAGRYLQSLADSFPPLVVGDMLCLIRLSAGLSCQATGDLLRRELGFARQRDPELSAKLKEMAFLEHSVGRAGRMALAPLAPRRARDLWEMCLLAESELGL